MWSRRKQSSQESELTAEPKKRLIEVPSQRAPAAMTPASPSKGLANPKPAFPSPPAGATGSASASTVVAALPGTSQGVPAVSGGTGEQSGVQVPPAATTPVVEKAAAERTPRTAERSPSMTTIGEGMEIDGSVTSASDLDVYGVIEGDVNSSGHVQVHPRAIVKGMISAQSVNVEGSIEGDVSTRGKLYIGAEGRVEGDVRVKSLNVEEGGSLLGRCMMT